MIISCSITWYVPTSLSLHTLSIEVSNRVSSIIQNQTRAFNKATDTYTKWHDIFLTMLAKYALARHVLEDEAFLMRPTWVCRLLRTDVDL